VTGRGLEENGMKTKTEGLSRRAFIGGVGTALASGTVAAALGAPASAVAAPPAVPWPVPRLDPDAVRDAAYGGYWKDDPYKGGNYGCAYGVAAALLGAIKAGLGGGSPWEALPLEMFKWGKTGVVESGTLCGALAGAMPIFTLAAPAFVTDMGADLVRWYGETAFPSREMDALDPKRVFPAQAQSVSGSPLCHVSVSRWCKASGKSSSSQDRKVRCGKISGDVAKMAAVILNGLEPGKRYVPRYGAAPELYAECVHCHVDAPPAKTADSVRLGNSLGVSNCRTCHPDAAPVMRKKR
jgi:hypothetical protein